MASRTETGAEPPPSSSSLAHLPQQLPPLLPSSLSRDSKVASRDLDRHPALAATHQARSQTLDDSLDSVSLVSLVSLPHHQDSLPLRLSAPVKRIPKPLSSGVSLLATRQLRASLSHPFSHSPEPDTRFDRPPFVDSPTLYDHPLSLRSNNFPPIDASTVLEPPSYPAISEFATLGMSTAGLLKPSQYDLLNTHPASDAPSSITHAQALEGISDRASENASDIASSYADHTLIPTPMFAAKPSPPHLRLEKVDTSSTRQQQGPQPNIDEHQQLTALDPSPGVNRPLPRSPGQASPLGSVFGWGGGGPSPSATEFSSISSPLSPGRNSLAHDGRRSTKGSFAEDTRFDAASTAHNRHTDTYLSTSSPSSPNPNTLVDEMEDELKIISSELAASIRREMDLEDLVEKLQEQMRAAPTSNKRSSDYFSDSGYSSAKLSDYDQNREEIDKIRRRSEQEKASIRLELANKLRDERAKRKELNRKIKELAEKASHVDIAQINSLDANDRIKTLEETCEDLRRKLSEERESRGNFEDLLTALKGQLQVVSDERDNLREEIVPELRARIEGLENEAAAYNGLTYESARMQQQLESLKRENNSLRNSMASGTDETPKRMSLGLSRSNSLGPSSMRSPKAPFPLARSESFKTAVPSDSREDLQQRLKDVEAQRDALHSALKSLLERQEFQNREHQKRIRTLENERQRLATSGPRKAVFDRDMSKLRNEISILQRRAEEALEQKWQVEKGLGSLRMDLDRAEEEIESLRKLLKERDILIPPSHARSSVSSDIDREPVSSESLENAYKELQSAHAESLAGQPGGETAGEGELDESALRMEDMALQVRQQLAANADLRQRLFAAVSRGETERRAHSQRIAEMQERLRSLEEQVVSAQLASEERVARHEEERIALQRSDNKNLRRFQAGARDGSKAARSSKLGPFLRLIPTKSFEDEAEMKKLRVKVAELEVALADTEREMQEVVAKMNLAQVEVLKLQEAREAAVRETRRLEQMVRQEQSRGFGGLFRSRD